MTTDPIPTICFKIRADEYPQPAHRCIHLNQHHLTKFKIAQLKLPLSDHQHNNRTSAAGMPTAWQPQVSVLAVSKEAFGQPGQPAVLGSPRAESRSVHLGDRLEEEDCSARKRPSPERSDRTTNQLIIEIVYTVLKEQTKARLSM